MDLHTQVTTTGSQDLQQLSDEALQARIAEFHAEQQRRKEAHKESCICKIEAICGAETWKVTRFTHGLRVDFGTGRQRGRPTKKTKT